jgi:hypothetical protein
MTNDTVLKKLPIATGLAGRPKIRWENDLK